MIRPLFTALLLALLACSQGSSTPAEDDSQQETASAERGSRGRGGHASRRQPDHRAHGGPGAGGRGLHG